MAGFAPSIPNFSCCNKFDRDGCSVPYPLRFLAMVVGNEWACGTQSPGSVEWSLNRWWLLSNLQLVPSLILPCSVTMEVAQRSFWQLKMWSMPLRSRALLLAALDLIPQRMDLELHKILGVTSSGYSTAVTVSPLLHMAERRPSSFNLLAGVPIRRPLSGSVAAFIVDPSPSGFVPGDGAGGRDVERIVFVGGEGLDSNLQFFFRVLFVAVEELVVFFFSFVVLYVKCYPTI